MILILTSFKNKIFVINITNTSAITNNSCAVEGDRQVLGFAYEALDLAEGIFALVINAFQGTKHHSIIKVVQDVNKNTGSNGLGTVVNGRGNSRESGLSTIESDIVILSNIIHQGNVGILEKSDNLAMTNTI